MHASVSATPRAAFSTLKWIGLCVELLEEYLRGAVARFQKPTSQPKIRGTLLVEADED